MHLFIGICKADYEDTDFVRTIAENKEQAKENIIKDIMKWDECSREEVEQRYAILDLTQIDQIDGYKITITKV